MTKRDPESVTSGSEREGTAPNASAKTQEDLTFRGRVQVPGSRFQVPGSRSHVSRLTSHVPRLTSHVPRTQKKLAPPHNAVRAERAPIEPEAKSQWPTAAGGHAGITSRVTGNSTSGWGCTHTSWSPISLMGPAELDVLRSTATPVNFRMPRPRRRWRSSRTACPRRRPGGNDHADTGQLSDDSLRLVLRSLIGDLARRLEPRPASSHRRWPSPPAAAGPGSCVRTHRPRRPRHPCGRDRGRLGRGSASLRSGRAAGPTRGRS